MKHTLLALLLCLLPSAALAQDKATLDTRQLLAETVTTAKPRTEYLNGTRDKQAAFVRVLTKYRQLTAAQTVPVKDPVLTVPVQDPVIVTPARKAVGMNISPPDWYGRQTFSNMLQGGYWASNWKPLAAEELTSLGYPKTWPATGELVRLLGVPTGGWIAKTSIACAWKGSGVVNFNGGINIVKGDHTIAFDMPSWEGAIKNRWFSIYGVNNADPLRDFECHDANPANATGHEFSKEIVASSSKYQVLRFMDWNRVNGNVTRTWATRVDPRSLENPGLAFENQFRLAELAGADPWFNHSTKDSADYIAGVAKYAAAKLPAGRKLYVEYGNELWNWQFPGTTDLYNEAIALKINPNNGYGAWINYSRHAVEDVFKVYEKAFADAGRSKDLVRVLGTQVAYAEVTRQEMNYPGIADHIDAIAGAPYFSHDRTKPYTDAALEADIASTWKFMQTTCDIARAKAPKVRCITYEGGQHELPTALLPQDQFEKLQRSPIIGELYGKYLRAKPADVDLITLYNDVGPITKYGAWGHQEYADQVGAPKQAAVDAFLKQ